MTTPSTPVPHRPVWVFPASPVDRAKLCFELTLDSIPFTVHDPATVDAFTRADQTRRLEVWVGVMPEEFSQHPRPAELMGLVVQASDRRAVMCTDRRSPTWRDDIAKIALFDRLDIDEWNERICPRCRCEGTTRTDEGLWWCRRHATRAWEPIEHREGVAWQEQRLVG